MPDAGSSPDDEAFRIWINRPSADAKHLGRVGAIIKRGRDVTKIVAVTNYGDKATGQIKKRELRFRTYEHRRGSQPNYDEPVSEKTKTWACENGEIERVLAFLQSDIGRTAQYRIVDTSSPAGIILDLLQNSDPDSQELANTVLRQGKLNQLIAMLSATEQGTAVAQLAVIEKRRKLIREFQELTCDPNATETKIQRLIGNSYWIFGGRYIGIAERRSLIPLDQYDIPLLGADGTLHIVELKGPVIPKLVRRHRNHWIAGNEINEAVGQAMNYIRGLDELGAAVSGYYQNELGPAYNMRRVFATVVIGHPDHATETGPDGRRVDERAVQDTIRSYNAP
jgi:hypothetical protein